MNNQTILLPRSDQLFQYTCQAMIDLAAPLRETDWVFDIALTGAAGFLRQALWVRPGASKNLLGERWTYAQENTNTLIGRHPPQGKYSRLSSALAMAAAAYSDACRVAFDRGMTSSPVMGVAMTSVVSTTRQRRGENSCRIAVRTSEGFYTLDAVMQKAQERKQTQEERRIEEGLLCDILTLLVILKIAGLPAAKIAPEWGVTSGQLVSVPSGAMEVMPAFIRSTPLSTMTSPFNIVLMPDQTTVPINTLDPDRYILFPGSFNPVHHGHHEIASMARQQTGKDVIYQITAHHPSKGVIPTKELLTRVAQLQFRWPVVLFNKEGLYAEKAAVVPGMSMLIGADVVYGLQNLRYYNNDKTKRKERFERLAALNTRFLVAGREINGFFETLGDVPVARNFSHLFHPLGGRVDVSSSQLRGATRSQEESSA